MGGPADSQENLLRWQAYEDVQRRQGDAAAAHDSLAGGVEHIAAQEVNVPSCISCYLGVTEPAMFGVNLKFHFPVRKT